MSPPEACRRLPQATGRAHSTRHSAGKNWSWWSWTGAAVPGQMAQAQMAALDRPAANSDSRHTRRSCGGHRASLASVQPHFERAARSAICRHPNRVGQDRPRHIAQRLARGIDGGKDEQGRKDQGRRSCHPDRQSVAPARLAPISCRWAQPARQRNTERAIPPRSGMRPNRLTEPERHQTSHCFHGRRRSVHAGQPPKAPSPAGPVRTPRSGTPD